MKEYHLQGTRNSIDTAFPSSTNNLFGFYYKSSREMSVGIGKQYHLQLLVCLAHQKNQKTMFVLKFPIGN